MVNINRVQTVDGINIFLLASPRGSICKHGVEHRGIIRIYQGDPLDKSILSRCNVNISKPKIMIAVKPVTFSKAGIGSIGIIIWSRIENKLIFPISRFIYKYINTQLPVARRKDTIRPALRQIIGDACHGGVEMFRILDGQFVGNSGTRTDFYGVEQLTVRSNYFFGDLNAFDIDKYDFFIFSARYFYSILNYLHA